MAPNTSNGPVMEPYEPIGSERNVCFVSTRADSSHFGLCRREARSRCLMAPCSLVHPVESAFILRSLQPGGAVKLSPVVTPTGLLPLARSFLCVETGQAFV